MEETNLKEEIRDLKEVIMGEKKKKKPKKFKIPVRARLRKSHLKRGYVIVQKFNENKVIDFIKKPIVDGTIKMEDTFHAVEDLDIYLYKNKPMVMQPKDKLNPFNPVDGKKETYGQKYIMARMKSDMIKATGRKVGGMVIFGVIIAAIIGYYFFTGGSFS